MITAKQQSEAFPWQPGGLSLLDKVMEIVEDNGGRAAMYDLVNDEVNGEKFKVNRHKMEEDFRNVIKYNISRNDASELMGMNFHAYDRLFKQFKKQNSL